MQILRKIFQELDIMNRNLNTIIKNQNILYGLLKSNEEKDKKE